MALDAATFQSVQYRFEEVLRQRGSKLIQAVQNEEIPGHVYFKRQRSYGPAHFVKDTGGITQYDTIDFARRQLKPEPIEKAIMLDDFESVRMGKPDTTEIAQGMADACGVLIDQIILKGIYGTAVTESGDVALPATQNIAWDSNRFGSDALVAPKLSASKIVEAVTKLKSAFVNSPIIVIANHGALASLRSDIKVASSDFNTLQAFAAGVQNPYGGVDAFIASEQVEVSDDVGGAAGSYAYAYAIDQITLGTNMPLFLKAGQNAERGLSDVLIYKGAYDCVRMQEKAVVRIACKD